MRNTSCTPHHFLHSLPISSIPPNLSGTPMAATSSHRIPCLHHLGWFILMWLLLSWNASLCFLVLPSLTVAELLFATIISKLLPSHRFSQQSPLLDLSTRYQNHGHLTHPSLSLSLEKKNVFYFYFFGFLMLTVLYVWFFLCLFCIWDGITIHPWIVFLYLRLPWTICWNNFLRMIKSDKSWS